ncbi:MAG: riboflavin synthase subunit alpha, partial [Pseudomonadales bacterium]
CHTTLSIDTNMARYMFTGIVQASLPITQVVRKPGFCSFAVAFPTELLSGLATGASVAVNGVCLTVTGIEGGAVHFDAIKETLELSNLRLIEEGSLVNVERSARADAEVGGHLLSGHIVGTAEVVEVDVAVKNNCRLTFAADTGWLKYVFEKGFLAVNGASLTVAQLDREAARLAINLIPETLARTNLSLLKTGDLVNIEVESQTQAIVETVERVMAERKGPALT